ncbi:leucine-rich repeat domain-containing protein [Echinicola sp. CAU 1574]|uniref:Leucine-rich repeat domain-containing protein n=1 Tax=Echinicola arenosa TaxID=2774144 RepID=A0ABR9AP45_9BACT|nr:leucine-rich repeat domain-containing protein [Echinicola arenosa]MBD8490559.1 leucine-rich repeat domain-containing protein [Echinicola arenosa]
MTKNRFYTVLLFFLLVPFVSFAQDMGGYSKQEIKDFSQKVEDQIQFLEYFLNTVGSEQTPARDKDVIITESYKKIFRDGKVQVEDDLVLDRQVITNKDVPAYLKDVEFFFKDASFKFKVRDVKPFLRDNGELSFVVSMDRTLNATGLDNEEIENTKPRFVEVNLDRQSNELKIASIYTTKLSRDKELTEWWGTLSLEWETYFREEFNMMDDSITVEHLNKISTLDSLDLSGNSLIQDLSPLEALRDLKYVDISNTMIRELGPISNVTFLSYLDVSNTPTSDIQFIKYSENLTYLNISNTLIENIDELSSLSNLRVLKAINTPLMSFAALNSFEALEELNLERSGLNNIESINQLKELKKLDINGNYLINFNFLSELGKLEEIDLSQTNISDLAPLEKLENLKVVKINQTDVNSLGPLDGKKSLQTVYADRTNISENLADDFARNNRTVLLIHNVENLQTWWDTLPDGWESVLRKEIAFTGGNNTPSVEEISMIVSVDSLDLSGSEIINLRPVLKFKKLISLKLDDTKIHDLSPLRELKTLKMISGNRSAVTNLEDLAGLKSLQSVSFDHSLIASIEPLKSLKDLEFLNVDGTEVPQWQVQDLLQVVPDVNVIFRTDELKGWWNSLDGVWKTIFVEEFGLSTSPDKRELHRLTSSRSISIEKKSIQNLRPLVDFINLQTLEIYDAPLSDISDLAKFEMLRNLKITQAPVVGLEPLAGLKTLETLNLSNTGVEDLRPLEGLKGLKTLILSGTGIKRLKGLEELYDLEELDIASTNVRSINDIKDLTNLKRLICFNTRINSRQIDSFRESNPECDVRFY